MRIEVFPDVETTARAAACLIAAEARQSVETHGRFVVALSGGNTPWKMLHALVHEAVPWDDLHIFQVDERVAPTGDAARNLVHIQECLLKNTPMQEQHIYAMPVEEDELDAAAAGYAETLRRLAGSPPVLDLVHLGLGADGHTASLVPGDPALIVKDVDVAVTGSYQGRRRLTLTYPVLNRAHKRLWLVTGEGKAEALRRLRRADPTIPASLVNRKDTLVYADRAAAGKTG